MKALKTIAPGGYEVWAHPIVQKGHLFYADGPKLTGGDGELDMGEIEGTFKPSAEKKRRYAVRVMERDDGGKNPAARESGRPVDHEVREVDDDGERKKRQEVAPRKHEVEELLVVLGPELGVMGHVA